MKLLLSMIIFTLLSNSALADCFLYQDNNFYCTDLPLQQAQIECSFYPDCNPAVHLSPTPCQNIQICQASDPLSLPVIVQQDAVNQLPAIVQDSQAKPATDNADKKSSATLWLLLLLVAFIVAVYYAFSRNWIPGLNHQKNRPQQNPGQESPWAFWPLMANPLTDKKINHLRQKHQKKVHQHEINSFLAEAGLAVDNQKKDIFGQLLAISRALDKRKQKLHSQLSQGERKVFENLEQLIQLSQSKTENSFKNLNKQAIKKDLQKAMADLRKLAGKSK